MTSKKRAIFVTVPSLMFRGTDGSAKLAPCMASSTGRTTGGQPPISSACTSFVPRSSTTMNTPSFSSSATTLRVPLPSLPPTTSTLLSRPASRRSRPPLAADSAPSPALPSPPLTTPAAAAAAAA